MRVLVAGDFCDNHRISDILINRQFVNIVDDCKSVINESDFRIVNFEFPIVDDGVLAKPISKAGPSLKGHRNSIDFLKYAGFNVCTLANNHILDQGESCCLFTKELIDKSGINTVGAGKNVTEAGEILYLKFKDESVAIINCCEHEFSIATHTTAGANPLNPIQQFYKIQDAKKNADFVLIIIHGGHEHCQLPSPRMKELYRFFVDVGADAVVNHHQHCYSGYEVYKGKPIFYGLGNFLFDWADKRNSPWNEGYMVSINFNKNTQPTFSLIPYNQCNACVSVSLMRGDILDRFNRNLAHLNNIIADDILLKRKWEEWILDNSNYFLMSFEPYISRITKALYIRGFLPSFITGKKKYGIINRLECESHLDRLKCLINSLKR